MEIVRYLFGRARLAAPASLQLSPRHQLLLCLELAASVGEQIDLLHQLQPPETRRPRAQKQIDLGGQNIGAELVATGSWPPAPVTQCAIIMSSCDAPLMRANQTVGRALRPLDKQVKLMLAFGPMRPLRPPY